MWCCPNVRRAVTLIQRFGSALNLNIHFHILYLDGVYLFKGAHPPLFRPVAGPGANELQRLVEQVGAQVGQVLGRRGLIERDIENAWLAGDFWAGPLDDLIGHSITCRTARSGRAGSRCMRAWTSRPSSARSSSGCAATRVARRWRKIAWRWPQRATCATP
jgi:hypothetical protein